MFHAVARITKSSTVYAAVKKYSFGTSCVTAASANATARVTAAKTWLLIGGSSPQEPRGPERERGEQEAKRNRWRPGRPEEGGGEGLGEPEHESAEQRPENRAHAAQHAHGEHQADEFAPDRRLHRLDHDEKGAGDAGGGDREGESELLDADGIHAHQAQRELVLGDREHGASEESVREKELDADDHDHGHEEGHDQAHREIDRAEPPGDVAVAAAHHPVVHAEDQDERDLGDEEYAEEERETAQRFLSAAFETDVIDPVQNHPQKKEQRGHRHRNDDRVKSEAVVDDVRDIRAQDDESRVRDVDDVEHPERDRDADAHRGVKPAEQEAGNDCVGEQRPRDFHAKKTAPAGFPAGAAQSLFLVFVVRRFQVPGLVFLGGKHGEAPGLLELFDVVADDAVVLGHHHPGRCPFAVLGESDPADIRVERVLVNVLGELGLVQTLGRGDRLIEHLHHRIGVGRQVEAERIHFLDDRASLVLGEELVEEWKLAPQVGHVELVVYDAVEERSELRIERGELLY